MKDIFNQLKAKIESGEVKANLIDFLNKLKAGDLTDKLKPSCEEPTV